MLLMNTHPDHRAALADVDADLLGAAGARLAGDFLTARDAATPTPLLRLPALAREWGLGAIFIKDEGKRLGLGSFKALGGSYAVARLVLEEAEARLGRALTMADLHTADVRTVAATMTMACATAGNHGRSVAQGAQMTGARAVIFLHRGVSEARAAAIASFGAEIVRVAGTYDDSVAEAARVAHEKDWTVVSDTAWPGYERIPGMVMQGYTAISAEALEQMASTPTHIFVQAGVGGIAGATAAYMHLTQTERRPKFIVVEPSRAACLLETARAGAPVLLPVNEPSVMAMLDCRAPSPVAWRVLARAADAFMDVEDDDAIAAMKQLATPLGDDPALVAGESGAAGFAGLMRASRDGQMRDQLGLNETARVLLIATEGATDPERYASLVGRKPEEVAGVVEA